MKIKKIGLFIGLYLTNIIMAIDQLGNALMFGDHDETISSRFGRRWPNSFFYWFIDTLFSWQPVNRHVISAIEEDEGKDDILPDRPEKTLLKIFIVVIFFIIILGLI